MKHHLKALPPVQCGEMQGFSLIEVLVTIVVLAIGLLGLAGTQMQSLQYSASAQQRSQATFLAESIADRMRSNRTNADAGAYDIAVGAIPTGTTLAVSDVQEWKAMLAARLPSGEGSICRTTNPAVACTNSGSFYRITIQWSDAQDARQGRATQQFLVVTQL